MDQDGGVGVGESRHFGPWDYVVFAAMLLLSAIIGIIAAFTGGRQRTTDEFLLGDRRMNIVPVAMSIVVSVVSAVSVIGTPAEIYLYDTMYSWVVVTNIIANFFLCRFFLPIFFRLHITSVYQYLELRFNRTVRLCGTIIFSVQTVIFMGINLYTPALAISAVTGFDLWACVLSTGVVCIFYTTLGGMKAVLWTDTLQSFIILFGVVAVITKGAIDVGGLDQAWWIADEGNRIKFLDVSFDPRIRYTVWSMVFGFATLNLAAGINQMTVQRLLSCGTEKKAVQAIVLATFVKGLIKGLTVISGIVMYAYYVNCDPLKAGVVKKTDQIMPLMVMDLFRKMPGLPGIFLSAVVSASLSTLSSGINALSAVAAEDGVKTIWPNILPQTYVRITKLLALGYGLLAIGFAFLASLLGQGILQLTVSVVGIGNGCVLGVFVLGIFMHRSNSKGAIAGLLTSILFVGWIKVGSIIYPSVRGRNYLSVDGCPVSNTSTMASEPMYTSTITSQLMYTEVPLLTAPNSSLSSTPERPAIAEFYAISFYWYSLIGASVCVLVGAIVSALTGFTDPKLVDSRLKYNVTDALFCCFPKSLKDIMRCGAETGFETEEEKDNEPMKVKSHSTVNMKEFWANRETQEATKKDPTTGTPE